jgi:hypothetical protein
MSSIRTHCFITSCAISYTFLMSRRRGHLIPVCGGCPQEYVAANGFLDEMLTLAANHGEFLKRMQQTVEKYLEHNGRRWVDMGSLFSFMKL